MDIDAALAHPLLARSYLKEVRNTAVKAHARIHGAEAIRLLRDVEDGERRVFLKAFVAGVADTDPYAATALLRDESSLEERAGAIDSIAWSTIYNGGLDQAERWLASLGNEATVETQAAFSALCEAARRGLAGGELIGHRLRRDRSRLCR